MLQQGEYIRKQIVSYLTGYALILGGMSVSTLQAVADPTKGERARYYQPDESSPLRFTPINLANGSKLTLISPQRWSETASTLIKTLNTTHEDFTDLFSEIPAFS